MGVLQGLVLMVVVLGKVEPDAESHEHAGSQQLNRQRLAQDEHGCDRAEERRRREIGAGAGSAKRAQGQHEEYEAHAIS